MFALVRSNLNIVSTLLSIFSLMLMIEILSFKVIGIDQDPLII